MSLWRPWALAWTLREKVGEKNGAVQVLSGRLQDRALRRRVTATEFLVAFFDKFRDQGTRKEDPPDDNAIKYKVARELDKNNENNSWRSGTRGTQDKQKSPDTAC